MKYIIHQQTLSPLIHQQSYLCCVVTHYCNYSIGWYWSMILCLWYMITLFVDWETLRIYGIVFHIMANEWIEITCVCMIHKPLFDMLNLFHLTKCKKSAINHSWKCAHSESCFVSITSWQPKFVHIKAIKWVHWFTCIFVIKHFLYCDEDNLSLVNGYHAQSYFLLPVAQKKEEYTPCW